MRILELGLAAFGPFTGRRLELRQGDPGLNVIYGANEAGKSSALRGLTALLYGIEVRTADCFIHPYDNLRLAGHLRLVSGREIRFMRRKGSKGTLLDTDGRPLPNDILEPFLGGVSEDEFRRVWGIDHARLQQGGRDLLEGKGDLADALFSAGAGIARLSRFRKELEQEAAALFAPRAQKPPVNMTLTRLTDLRSKLRKATLTTSDWERAEQAVKRAQETLQRLDTEVRELRRRRSRLERVLRTAPLIRDFDLVQDALAAHADTPSLPEGFSSKRKAAQKTLREATVRLDVVTSLLVEEQKRLETLGSPAPILREADVIRKLRTNFGSYQQGAIDRPGLVTQRDAHEQRAAQILQEVRPDLSFQQARGLRSFLGRRDRISNLIKTRTKLDERDRALEERRQDLRGEEDALARREAELPEPQDPASLRAVTDATRERGDTEAELCRVRDVVEARIRHRDDAMRRLGVPGGLVDRLASLPVPQGTLVDEFVSRLKELATDERDARKETERLQIEQAALDARISALVREHPVPSLSDLTDLRIRRDELLEQLRSPEGWAQDDGSMTREVDPALWERYRELVRQADECADRLRVEAARVAELEKLRADAEAGCARLENLREADAQRSRERERLDGKWSEAWAETSIAAPEIPAARDWLRDFKILCDTAGQAREAEQQRDELERWIAGRLSELHEAIQTVVSNPPPLLSLRQALKSADEVIKQIDEERQARSDVRKDRLRLAADREKLARDEESYRRDLDAWVDAWQVATCGLLGDVSDQTDDVEHALGQLDAAFRALDESEGYAERIRGIDARASSYLESIRALAQRLDKTVLDSEEDCIRWLERAQQRLDEENKQETAREQCRSNIDTHREEAQRLRENIGLDQAKLRQLREEAGCGPDDDLEEFEKRCWEAAQLRDEARRLERDLRRYGDGLGLDELREENEAEEVDGREGRLDDLKREIERLDAPGGPRAQAQEALAAARLELEIRGGATAAAELSQEFQETLSELRDLVWQHARLKAASALLARRIEIYRRENQAPLLRSAGDLFRRMTRESFTSLEADLDEERPILVGIRPDGTPVRTEGMSEGTRDQLYLALRLAAVENACKKMEPMPFIVDDILVQFDDDRSTATLQVLSQVAKTTQILLFTHHRHVRDAAERLGPEQGVFVQDL